MFPCRDVKILSQREADVFRLSLDEKKDVLITRLLLLPSWGTYLPSRGHREPYRHIPDIKINATSLMEFFLQKPLHARANERVCLFSRYELRFFKNQGQLFLILLF